MWPCVVSQAQNCQLGEELCVEVLAEVIPAQVCLVLFWFNSQVAWLSASSKPTNTRAIVQWLHSLFHVSALHASLPNRYDRDMPWVRSHGTPKIKLDPAIFGLVMPKWKLLGSLLAECRTKKHLLQLSGWEPKFLQLLAIDFSLSPAASRWGVPCPDVSRRLLSCFFSEAHQTKNGTQHQVLQAHRQKLLQVFLKASTQNSYRTRTQSLTPLQLAALANALD